LHSEVTSANNLKYTGIELANSAVDGAINLKNAGVDLANAVETGAINGYVTSLR
jgi:hypothetical protein